MDPRSDSASMTAGRKGAPTITDFIPGGMCSGGMEESGADIFFFRVCVFLACAVKRAL